MDEFITSSMARAIDGVNIPEMFDGLEEALIGIFLIEAFGRDLLPEQGSRLNHYTHLRDAIKAIILYRFDADDIRGFLENGYPRQVDLSKAVNVTRGGE